MGFVAGFVFLVAMFAGVIYVFNQNRSMNDDQSHSNANHIPPGSF